MKLSFKSLLVITCVFMAAFWFFTKNQKATTPVSTEETETGTAQPEVKTETPVQAQAAVSQSANEVVPAKPQPATAAAIDTTNETQPAQKPPENTDTAVTNTSFADTRKKIMAAAIADIDNVFKNGQPLKVQVLQNLKKLRGGVIEFYDGREQVDFDWSMSTETLSLKFGERMQSCKASEHLKGTTDDPAAILILSCDKNFYIQLYRDSESMYFGNFFERISVNNSYKRSGYVHLLM